jgi:hypothetical protein
MTATLICLLLIAFNTGVSWVDGNTKSVINLVFIIVIIVLALVGHNDPILIR